VRRWVDDLVETGTGLAIGGARSLLDGLSGFLAPSLAPVTGSMIAFSLMEGAGLAIGYMSKRFHSMFATQKFGKSVRVEPALRGSFESLS
jgi:hypothetical protein